MKFSQWVPKKGKRLVKRIIKGQPPPTDLRTSLAFQDVGPHGPLLSGLFARIKEIPGAFNVDDTSHFHLVLSMQSHLGLHGDLLEIGSSHGRSTAVMARGLLPDERIHVCDAFQMDTEDRYASKPTTSELMTNLRKATPELKDEAVVIHSCLSNDLQLPETQKFRFIHIDGGHSKEQALFDLNLCREHLLPKGVMVVDDYEHGDWPGVKEAVDTFLGESRGFTVLADLNRHGARGRKIYLRQT